MNNINHIKENAGRRQTSRSGAITGTTDNTISNTISNTIRSRRKPARIRARKVAAMLILFLVLVLSGFCGRRVMNALAKDSACVTVPAPSGKYYTSVLINEGDSLWSLAKKYGAGSGRDTLDYIRELRQINRLAGDTIHAGHYLTVIYYK